MSAEVGWGLVGVFVGGALPWLEAVVVIPAGILAGLPAVPVIIAGTGGNLLTVGIAAYAGEGIRQRWSARRQRRRTEGGGPDDKTGSESSRAAKAAKRRARIERLMNRGGLPLLALVGPLGLGTQISAVVAVATGVRATTAFLWIGAATVLWCIVAAIVTLTGFEFLGIGD